MGMKQFTVRSLWILYCNSPERLTQHALLCSLTHAVRLCARTLRWHHALMQQAVPVLRFHVVPCVKLLLPLKWICQEVCTWSVGVSTGDWIYKINWTTWKKGAFHFNKDMMKTNPAVTCTGFNMKHFIILTWWQHVYRSNLIFCDSGIMLT